jgi:hypothetical protein
MFTVSNKTREAKMKVSVILLAFVASFAAIAVHPAGAQDATPVEAVPPQMVDPLQTLQKDNALLQEKIRILESIPRIDSETLSRKNCQRLQDIARDTKAQRQAMADFEAFVKWMTGNLSGYSKYIEAGSFAAGFAKVLPIPYAGQASVLTKFISQGVLSLNAASVSIARYLATSRQFIAKADALAQSGVTGKSGEISEAVQFADEQLLRDMNDVRGKLAATAEISSSTLSFLESLNHYAESTDEYWNKTKSFITRTEADKKEKSFLSQSIQNLKNGAGRFNARLKVFDETVKKDEPLIKSMGAYEELIRELNAKTAKTKTEPVLAGK